jgi:polyhydroxyalkanoate synthesis regulator phasin
MAEKPQTPESKPPIDTPAAVPAVAGAAGGGPIPPKRGPGHRGADVRDTVAEMAARAQEISQEAGSKMASAMRDIITAAAGLSGFAVDSARDLVQYMVRRGQMTQEEADKLIREAEEAASKRKVNLPPPPSKVPKPPAPVPVPVAAAVVAHTPPVDHRPEPAAHPKVEVKKAAPAPAAKKAAPKTASHAPAKKPAAKPPAKASAKPAKPAAKKSTKKR